MITSTEITSTAEQLIRVLPNRVTPKRADHIFRVAEAIDTLSLRFGIGRSLAHLAAIAHDFDRDLPPAEAYAYVSNHHLSLYEIERHEPKMVHGVITADRLKREYGVTDRSVLHAVRHHTLGHPEMDALGKALFVADYIEPGRKTPAEERKRIEGEEKLDAMVLRILEINRYRFGPLEEPTAGLYARLREGME